MPEVETIKLQIKEEIKGKKIESVKVILDKPLKNTTTEEFKQRVEGTFVKDVKRRAKILIIELSTGDSLLIHLKLTGRLLYLKPEEPIEKHTHLVFNLSDGKQLRFWDLRQFGYVKIVSGKPEEAPELRELGPEALELGLDEFRRLLAGKRSGKIKPLLMNQNFIAGIGNIYSDEMLFYAGIQPTRDVTTLTDGEIVKLHEGIKKILSAAVRYKGSSVDDYVDLYGEQGDFVMYHKVYRRTGKPCEKCGTPIKRIKLAGRSAHFCPKCQV
ncbi:bifunctional DNA-formamidopyrimidine glycosylase/DNA-(apurinic or apyrimidinic site) lyase [Candidatus Oleimmundimicrobium sp.]|uniref:bifunctional DNA-formamidopyrimidine glycosylase/DNA-(apurinic or apyrimidinic site) lyase n=1 Tax=Candidatus Oleimmundimicrobium sp. TaxID=3060597 RepID=UPI002717600A|nr:bifunctional DNA-formamidopyrimidine glycosylase/DNA-(apurinic or apyrimidinic site) lyase [Candidatus Oleimmundimicrobium sp.]MDO8886553.1 bifunctional DNA-formamidopyrimidine glycosylase/DNA-(apurinic or apyrimidinic site) lyase [Candidatus Oleimmundimicrobium sp.]